MAVLSFYNGRSTFIYSEPISFENDLMHLFVRYLQRTHIIFLVLDAFIYSVYLHSKPSVFMSCTFGMSVEV